MLSVYARMALAYWPRTILTAGCKLYVAIEVLRVENFDSRVFSLDVRSEPLLR